ncbi:hypothetical protein AB0P04_41085, partial [Streptomyces anulatus]
MTTSLADVASSNVALRGFLHGLPGVDRVGADQRAAMLGTRSIKTTAKALAIDLAIRMVDLTTLEGAPRTTRRPRQRPRPRRRHRRPRHRRRR